MGGILDTHAHEVGVGVLEGALGFWQTGCAHGLLGGLGEVEVVPKSWRLVEKPQVHLERRVLVDTALAGNDGGHGLDHLGESALEGDKALERDVALDDRHEDALVAQEGRMAACDLGPCVGELSCR